VQEPVEDRGGEDLIAEKGGPLGELLVGGDDRGYGRVPRKSLRLPVPFGLQAPRSATQCPESCAAARLRVLARPVRPR